MKTKIKVLLLLAAIAFFITGFLMVVLQGSSYTLEINTYGLSDDPSDFSASIEGDHEIVRVTDKRVENGMLFIDIKSVSKGEAFIEISGPEGRFYYEKLFVHNLGVITVNSFFGGSRGVWIIPILEFAFLLLLLFAVIFRFRADMKTSIYQYRNIRNLGWIIFLIFVLVGLVPYLFSGTSFVRTVSDNLSSVSGAASIVFPVAFVVSILVAISNVKLMRKEGRNWRNMLGLMLGVLICFLTIFPVLLSEILQQSTIVDVHNEQGAALYIEMGVTNSILVITSYLECILLATIILAIVAAKKVPSFDKDYILILGCQIKKDGTLTPLLKGRADRALEFSRMQKEATGKDIIFVPSGGKGDDEVIAEAQAVRNYLLSEGVSDERILVEDGSKNTDENFKKSFELIRKNNSSNEPKVAFSTTNYHVLRAGILANRIGLHAQGIGSNTKSYFWINAFVREFIATVANEWKKHLKVLLLLVLLTIGLVLFVRMSNVL